MIAAGRYSLLYPPGVVKVDIAAIDFRLEDWLEQARSTNTKLLDGRLSTASSTLNFQAKVEKLDQYITLLR